MNHIILFLGERVHHGYLEYDPDRVYIDGIKTDNEFYNAGDEEDKKIIHVEEQQKNEED